MIDPRPISDRLSEESPSNSLAAMKSARAKLISLLTAMRPERGAGGYPWDDGAVQFYGRVNSLLGPTMILLDYGSGRGRQFDVPDPGYSQLLQNFQGKVFRVIGIDIHDGIHDHPHLDERHVVKPGDVLPIAAGTVDIVVADWVLEHLENPAEFAAEMLRLVRPGRMGMCPHCQPLGLCRHRCSSHAKQTPREIGHTTDTCGPARGRISNALPAELSAITSPLVRTEKLGELFVLHQHHA